MSNMVAGFGASARRKPDSILRPCVAVKSFLAALRFLLTATPGRKAARARRQMANVYSRWCNDHLRSRLRKLTQLFAVREIGQGLHPIQAVAAYSSPRRRLE